MYAISVALSTNLHDQHVQAAEVHVWIISFQTLQGVKSKYDFYLKMAQRDFSKSGETVSFVAVCPYIYFLQLC